jgi:catechol 2,3-dioxygenase-like lactoylglutathione lyase family enzyme
MRRLVVLLATSPLLAQTLPAQGPVVGIGNFIHVVADLEKTVAFYRDNFKLELTGAPGPRAFATNEFLEKLYDAKGAQSRVAAFKVPGSTMGLEFVEFRGIKQTAHRLKMTDPGASILKLPGAEAALLQDPDGFYIQRAPHAEPELVLVTDESGKTLYLFRNLLGVTPQFHVNFSSSRPAGGVTSALHDPGAGVIRVLVRDVDGLVKSLKSGGFAVASANGEVAVTNDRHYVILRDPDGFFFQLFPAPEPPK